MSTDVPEEFIEYVKKRWLTAHELLETEIRRRPSGGILVLKTFTSCLFVIESCSLDEIKNRVDRFNVSDTLDTFEANTNEWYNSRNLIKPCKPPEGLEYIASWFEIKTRDGWHSITLGGRTFALYIDGWAAKLEKYLRRYEERRLAIIDVMRILPLPISQAINTHI